MRNRLLRSRRGSVSVYLILLIAPLFVFHAVLIDVVRVKIAERETESALKSALRSTLAAFDEALQTYGLYALGVSTEEAETELASMMSLNLTPPAQKGDFRLVAPSLVEGSVQLKPLHTLGNQVVFKRQILEEMKYRAPMEFALNVTDKFQSGTTAALTNASRFSRQAEQAERWVRQRESLLDEAWRLTQTLAADAERHYHFYAEKLAELNEKAEKIGTRDAAQVQRELQSIREQAQQLESSIRSQQMILSELARNAQQNAAQIQSIMASIQSMSQSLALLQQKISDLESLLRLIAEYTLLMNAVKAAAKTDEAALHELALTVMALIDEAKRCDEEIRKLAELSFAADGQRPSPELIASAIRPDDYYMRYKTGIGGVDALFSGFATAVDATTLFSGPNVFDGSRYEVLNASNEAYAAKARQLMQEQGALENERAEANRRAENEQRNETDRIGTILHQLQQLAGNCAETDPRHYAVLEKGDESGGTPALSAKYAAYNRFPLTAGEEPSLRPDRADNVWEDAAGLIDRFAERMAEAARSFRDELYLNEYALSKFNYRTFGKEKDGTGQPKKIAALSEPERHPLQYQEAEYILYGFDSCPKNQSAAYAELFAFRLAVRMTESLLEPKRELLTFGHPLLTVLWAAAEGAVRAFDDMTDLVNGAEVPLSDKLSGTITLNYKDYLRIFMMLHGSDRDMMARMQSLIELNTGKDLLAKPVYVQANGAAQVKLWFLPFVSDWLNADAPEGAIELRKTAALSY